MGGFKALGDARRQLPGLVEPPRGAQLDVLPGVLGPVELGEYPLRVIGVVQEEQQVAQADQHVRAVSGGGQRVGGTVHVAHHVDSHVINING